MTLPDWLVPLPDADAMRAVDRWAIEERQVPSLDLMERAGFGIASLVAEVAPGGRTAVVCGKGNNGGDGLVAARFLREEGWEVEVLLLSDAGELQGDAAANLGRLGGAAPRPFSAPALAPASIVVDAMLGTGFSGAPREPVAGAIDAINEHGAPVVAADVPSGVDASTGTVEGRAVHASATATFHAAKPGLWIAPGKGLAGDVRVIEIGIPHGAPEDADVGLIEPSVLDLVPPRHAGSTKFTEGAVLVVGGSRGLTGAPILASTAATRAGAGYVTACVPASLNLVFELGLLEAMTVPLADEDGSLRTQAAGEVIDRAGRVQAVVLGPGIGRAEGAVACVREVAARLALPLLLDADGLNAHAGRLDALARREAPTVLTPHAGELGRLLGVEPAAVEAERLRHARDAASASGAVVVLKGDDSIVAEPSGRAAVSPGGSPALATAGAGDVLSGVIAAMLAKGLEPFAAACAGVHLHARAGQVAAERLGASAVIARDVVEALPAARAAGR